LKNKMHKLIKRIDFWLIIGLVMLAVGIYIWYAAIFENTNGFLYAQITIDGEIRQTVELSIDRTFSPGQLPNVSFEVRGGAIAFIKSDCPDQICVDNGFLSRAGQVSVCLPNLISLIIHATDGSEESIDIIAH